ncbi:MAG: four helix bundle protein [Bacteroidetes bacterium]|nr:MAG: four helix bundle protein [Bacteroidota bacterium]
MDRDLCGRLFKFSIEVIKFLRIIKNTPEITIMKYQLTKSATSGGANYEEAQAASSKADFRNKITISLREMRESNYWLRIFKELKIGHKETCEYLVNESVELKKILGSIASKVSK